MGAIFACGIFFRFMMWYTVKAPRLVSQQFEMRVQRYIAAEKPGVRRPIRFTCYLNPCSKEHIMRPSRCAKDSAAATVM